MRQLSHPCMQQRLQKQFPARAPLELLRCAVRPPQLEAMGFPLLKRYLVEHGLHYCRCAVALLPPADVGIPLCVPLDAFRLQQTDTYPCQAVGLRFLNRRVALRILCADTTLAFGGTFHVCNRLCSDARLAFQDVPPGPPALLCDWVSEAACWALRGLRLWAIPSDPCCSRCCPST